MKALQIKGYGKIEDNLIFNEIDKPIDALFYQKAGHAKGKVTINIE